MNLGKTQIPRIMDLARQLEADIARRKLQPGDGYLTLAETAKMLKVSTATANRALQLLAQRKILVRVQRKGSVIGALHRHPSPGHLRRVYMFVHRAFLRQEGIAADGVLVGIQSELSGAEVQYNFLPETDPKDYVNGLISEIVRSREPAGIVMTKAPFVVQRLVEESGLPAVVHGSLYPSIKRLSSVDQDNKQVARFMAEYAINQGCKHICAIVREVIFPGDNFVLSELGTLFGAAGFDAGAFEIAHLPDDSAAVETEIAALISRHPSGLALLCRSEIKANAAMAVIKRLGLKAKKRPTVILSSIHGQLAEKLPLPCVSPCFTPEETGAAIGRVLARHAVDPKLPPTHISVPVALGFA